MYFPFEYFSKFFKIALPPQVKFCCYASVSSISTLAIISNSMSVFHCPTAVEFFFWLAMIFYWIFAKYPCSYIDKHLSTVSSKIFWDLHYKIIFRIYWIGLGQTLFLQTFFAKFFWKISNQTHKNLIDPHKNFILSTNFIFCKLTSCHFCLFVYFLVFLRVVHRMFCTSLCLSDTMNNPLYLPV